MGDAIPAATILLLRDSPHFEVMMVERHAEIVFAGGAMVFPGGRIDPGDHDEEWRGCCDGLDAFPSDQFAPRVAAVREAFEETGVLLARRGDAWVDGHSTAALTPWRKRIECDDRLFLELVKTEGLRLALDALHLFARWRPPKDVGHKRFDTWFFAARAPEDQIAEADGNEAMEIIWTTPMAALADRDAGRRKMIFPTSRNVELLNKSNSTDEVFRFAVARSIRVVEPRIIERDGEHFLTIPRDMGYPITEERLETAMRA